MAVQEGSQMRLRGDHFVAEQTFILQRSVERELFAHVTHRFCSRTNIYPMKVSWVGAIFFQLYVVLPVLSVKQVVYTECLLLLTLLTFPPQKSKGKLIQAVIFKITRHVGYLAQLTQFNATLSSKQLNISDVIHTISFHYNPN